MSKHKNRTNEKRVYVYCIHYYVNYFSDKNITYSKKIGSKRRRWFMGLEGDAVHA